MYSAACWKYELFWKVDQSFMLKKKMTTFESRQKYYFLFYVTHFSKLETKTWEFFTKALPFDKYLPFLNSFKHFQTST